MAFAATKKVVDIRSRQPKHSKSKRQRPQEFQPPIIDIPEPGTSDETATQRMMHDFLDLENEYFALRDKYLDRKARIEGLVMRGAERQPGDRKIQTHSWTSCHPKYKQALIDATSEKHQQKVKAAAARFQVVRIRVE